MDANRTARIDQLATAVNLLLNSLEEIEKVGFATVQLNNLSVDLQSLVTSAIKLTIEQSILKSLRFKSLTARETKIASAHGKTFGWTFSEESRSGFVE